MKMEEKNKDYTPFVNIDYWDGAGRKKRRDVGIQQKEKEKKKTSRMCNMIKLYIYAVIKLYVYIHFLIGKFKRHLLDCD